MPYSKAYTGTLAVEEEAFELRAERFSVRTRDAERTDIVEVAFKLEGDRNAYWIQGVSTIAPDGRYVSEPLPVTWEREYAGVDEAGRVGGGRYRAPPPSDPDVRVLTHPVPHMTGSLRWPR